MICGAIGFLLGGLLGGYFIGRNFAKEYRQTIKSLQEENEQLRDQLHKKTEESFSEREKAVNKAEKRIDKNLNGLKAKAAKVDKIDIQPEKPTTAEIERLSEAYRSDAFNAHFADRVAPDDSDDVGDDDENRLVDSPVEDADEKNRKDLHIRMIDRETFNRDIEVRDSDTYTYYQEDGVLVNDLTQEVETDQFGVLGEEAMEIIDSTEQDEIYINNEPDDMLYDIVVDHNLSYYRDVLGY